MDKSIETLIRMSIEAGSISEEKMQAIRAKAEQLGISEGELKIYVDFLIKESKNTVQNQLKNISEKGKDEALKQFKTIQGHLSEKNIGGISKYIQLIKEGADKRTVKIFAGIVVFVFIFRLMFCGSSFEELTKIEWEGLVTEERTDEICDNYYNYQKNGKRVSGKFIVSDGRKKTEYVIKKGVLMEEVRYENYGKRIIEERLFDNLGRLTKNIDYGYGDDKNKDKITSSNVGERKWIGDECGELKESIDYVYIGNKKKLLVKEIDSEGQPRKYFDGKGNEITSEDYYRILDEFFK